MTAVVPSVDELREAGFFSPLEVHLARRLLAMAGEVDAAPTGELELRLLGAALAGRGPLHGQVCVSLREPPDLSALIDDDAVAAGRPSWRWPDPDAWAASLRRSALVNDGASSGPTPLVLDDEQQLYLYRYWQYQERLVSELRRRAGVLEQGLRPDALRRGLRRLFGDGDDAGPRGQRRAAAMAICRRLSVIAGGPGTGKTTTVLKLLALLQEQARDEGRFPLRLVLLAPTGKAAARLSAAISSGKAALASDAAIAASIPDEAATIHRALVPDRRRPTRFVHDAASPLVADVVVVDEASMVDLALMTKLVEAVPPGARLILLGDRDQLSSVEAGAILGDLCGAGGDGGGWSPEFSALIDEATGAPGPAAAASPPAIADCVAHLNVSYRFGDDSGIGALSRAINRGDTGRALAYLALEDTAHPELERYGDLDWVVVRDEPGVDSRPEAVLGRRLVEGFQPYLVQLGDPAAALAAFDRFRVLCAHRRGAFGVAALNELVRRQLARAGLVEHRGTWYEGRPVMITRNDAVVGLHNGDVGLTLRDPETGELRVHFADPAAAGGARSFAPSRLPAHETAFALTVHKSQGSEFDEVLFLLPGQVSPIVSRELIYTGVTRARRKVTIVASRAVIHEAITRRVRRASGLRKALWGA